MGLFMVFAWWLTAISIGSRSLAGGMIGSALIWGGIWIAYSNMAKWGWL